MGFSTSPNLQAEKDDLNNTSQNNYKNISQFTKKSNRNNNNRNKNKDCKCPFRCGTCDLLGRDLVKLKYNFDNILEDDSKLIFVPMWERV